MVAASHLASLPALLRVRRLSADLLLVEWRTAAGEILAEFYREECIEIWRGEVDPDLHRASSSWGPRFVECLKHAWDLPGELIEQHTKHPVGDGLPRELLVTLTEIVFDPPAFRSRDARAVEVR